MSRVPTPLSDFVRQWQADRPGQAGPAGFVFLRMLQQKMEQAGFYETLVAEPPESTGLLLFGQGWVATMNAVGAVTHVGGNTVARAILQECWEHWQLSAGPRRSAQMHRIGEKDEETDS